jgi:hypothetical protein
MSEGFVKRILGVSLAALAVAACSESSVSPAAPDQPAAPPAAVIATADVIVASSSNAGAGSFRDAVEQANADPAIRSIAFDPSVSTIDLQSGVLFTGTQDLTIHGNHATIDGAGAGGTAFTATGGGNLTLIALTVRNAPGEGVRVEVPASATGTITVSLSDVDIVANAGHGVLVNDQEDPSTQDGVQPNANGSDASVAVIVADSRFIGNGYSVSDRDGLRVNEGGGGDLSLTLSRTRAEDNAADGVEIDERGVGDVHIDVSVTRFTGNGQFDPADLDDGFDIDEYNDGGIIGTVAASSASHNFEEGFDINENNAGDLRVTFSQVEAGWNGEEGIDLEEDDDFGAAGDPNGGGGDLVTVMEKVRTTDNGDAADGALKIREKEAGSLSATLTDIVSTGNIGSGIFVRESSDGSSVVSLDKVASTANQAGALDPFSLGHGIELLESGGGNMTATVSKATVAANAGNGVFGGETGAGTGTVTLTNVQGAGNALGATGGGATFLP